MGSTEPAMKAIPAHRERLGTLAAFGTFGIWGMFPLYWHMLSGVEAFQVLAHRVLWALLFTSALLVASGGTGELAGLLKDRKRLVVAGLAGFVIVANWGVYIWAINSGRVLESSLGYYFNPILSVTFGAIFFREKVDRWTAVAIGVAATGLVGATVLYGSLPWTSLLISITFAAYGVMKKRVALSPLVSLTVETLAVAPVAIVLLAVRHSAGVGAFGAAGALPTVLLALSGVVTAIPLLLFAFAANSVPLQRVGFIQLVSPTLQLALGVFVFGEKPGLALIVAFTFVISSALIYVATRGRADGRKRTS